MYCTPCSETGIQESLLLVPRQLEMINIVKALELTVKNAIDYYECDKKYSNDIITYII